MKVNFKVIKSNLMEIINDFKITNKINGIAPKGERGDLQTPL